MDGFKDKRMEMKGPVIGPIVSHNVRGFLQNHGVALHPGMSLDEALSALYVGLGKRRDDDDFWRHLTFMLDAILACGKTPEPGTMEPASTVGFVESFETASVIPALRTSFPEGQRETTVPTVRRFLAKLSGPVLTGFLLLGIAASSGCRRVDAQGADSTGTETGSVDSSALVDTDPADGFDTGPDTGPVVVISSDTLTDMETETEKTTGSQTASATQTDTEMAETETSDTDTADTDTADTATTDTDTADTATEWSDDCTLDSESVLFKAIDESDSESFYGLDARKTLCTCMAALNKSWADGLTELFTTATDEEIAQALEQMLLCCRYSPSQLDMDYEEAEENFLAGSLCYLPLPYKGVSFPPDVT
jgi:hypothetical protein